jgi:hypothetical protein
MGLFNRSILFQQYPVPVKLAIVFMTLGWIFHFIFYFLFLVGDTLVRNDYIMLAIGIGICFFTASINRWARMLAIFFNIGIIALYLLICISQRTAVELRAFSALVVITFGISTYFLFKRETAAYFKSYNQMPAEPDTGPKEE